jgi:hypothetical protein
VAIRIDEKEVGIAAKETLKNFVVRKENFVQLVLTLLYTHANRSFPSDMCWLKHLTISGEKRNILTLCVWIVEHNRFTIKRILLQ